MGAIYLYLVIAWEVDDLVKLTQNYQAYIYI